MDKFKENYHIITNVVFDYSKPDSNNRVYPKEVFEKAIEEYRLKVLIKERKEKIKKLN
jgi:hypothetical protein